MTKKLNICIILLGVLMNFNCTPKKTNNELIIGNWELDSINKHSDGVDRIIKVDNDENLFVGSFTNRIYFKFSKYNESFIYCKKYSTEKRFSKFEIIKDSIVTKSFGNSKILELNEKNLTIEFESKIDYVNMTIEHPKEIITAFYHKVSNEKGTN